MKMGLPRLPAARLVLLILWLFVGASTGLQVENRYGRAPWRASSPASLPGRRRRPMIGMGLLDTVFGGAGAEDDYSPLGRGVSVVKVQVALACRDRSATSIVSQISSIAERTDTESARGLASLVSDTCLALLRCRDDWIAAASTTETFRGKDGPDKAETAFNRAVTAELAKFEKEYYPNEDERDVVEGGPTLAVISILLAIRGDSTTFDNVAGSSEALRKALQTVAADCMAEKGDVVVAAELLWTPTDPMEVIEKRDMLLDYPELIEV